MRTVGMVLTEEKYGIHVVRPCKRNTGLEHFSLAIEKKEREKRFIQVES